jgi:hypothetical protein
VVGICCLTARSSSSQPIVAKDSLAVLRDALTEDRDRFPSLTSLIHAEAGTGSAPVGGLPSLEPHLEPADIPALPSGTESQLTRQVPNLERSADVHYQSRPRR